MAIKELNKFTNVNNIEAIKRSFEKFGTDKTGYHTYDLVYGSLFEDLHGVENVLEVGIHLGASLKAWKDIFENANIIGLENNRERFFSESRITSMYVDQSIKETFDNFKNIINPLKFDFIIDDGCHYREETYNTFINLFPLLKVGGWYVVEDIKKEDQDVWTAVNDTLPNNFKGFLIDMNDLADTNGDNFIFAVKALEL